MSRYNEKVQRLFETAMRVQLRIVAGQLRGRKVTSTVHPGLRPTPDMVREALFSILGNAVPGRPFFDVFAGTGVIGLEALSRGASRTIFIERDFRLAQEIENHLREFGQAGKGEVRRADVYRWADTWQPPREPVNVFLSPPFVDFERRMDDFLSLVATLRRKIEPDSVLVLQTEKHVMRDSLTDIAAWDVRHYGRNDLLIWVKEREEDRNTPPTP
jgi:16S rRNA (guanine966-N2)-methyltransferase